MEIITKQSKTDVVKKVNTYLHAKEGTEEEAKAKVESEKVLKEMLLTDLKKLFG